MSWGTKQTRKEHKIQGKSYVTFMVIPDPTKSAKTIKIPKWIRFPIFGILIAIVLSVLFIIDYTAELEYQIAVSQLDVQTKAYAIEDKDKTIENLELTNGDHYQKLKSIQTLAVELEDRLDELEQHKTVIDSKLNGTDKTTNEQPSERLEVRQAEQLVVLSNEVEMEAQVASVKKDNHSFDEQINELLSDLENSSSVIEEETNTYSLIDDQVDEMIPFWEAYPSILPVKNTRVTSPYGWRKNPFGYNRYEFHRGVDLSAKYVSVYATGKGTVTFAGYDSIYGWLIVIDHGYGITTKYAHNYKLYVSKGDTVERNDIISKSGNSGRSTAPHVHYEVLLYGETQNPLDYVYEGE